jgi:bile acid:Na+ symporter, BASS family
MGRWDCEPSPTWQLKFQFALLYPKKAKDHENHDRVNGGKYVLSLPDGTKAPMTLQALILLVLKTSIALDTLGLGLRSTFSEATSLFRRPADLGRAFVSMNVVMPLFALSLAMTFDLHPAVKIALVALSVSPVPPLFPHKASEAGGREAYTLGLLVAMAVLAIVVIPITMEIFGSLTTLPLQMSVRSVASLVGSTIVLPLFGGIALRKLAPGFAQRAARPVGILAGVLLVLSVVPVLFVSARTILSLIGNGTVLSLVAFALLGLGTGYLFGGPDPENRRVLALATSSRHPGIAVAIANTNFPNQKLAIPAIVLYLIISIISGIVVGVAAKRGKAASPPSDVETRKAA